MNKSSFSILSKIQDLSLSSNEITGSYDGLNSFLNVDCNFFFRAPTKEITFDVISISAKLRFQSPRALISKTHIHDGTPVKQDLEIHNRFNFQLTESAFHFIENHRNNDVNFILELEILVYMKNAMNCNGYMVSNAQGAINMTTKLDFSIPRSVWVERILPSLGFHNLKLIEIPLTHRTLKEAYDNIISEFNKAEEYFNKSDYNMCIAHCRHSMDALTRNLKKIKENQPSEKIFEWLKKIDSSTYKWIDEMNKTNSAICGTTHHSGLKRDFTRHEAESIYLVMLGLLNLIGHMK